RASKPDLTSCGPGAGSACARSSPSPRRPPAMGAAAALAARYRDPAYRDAYKSYAAKVATLGSNTAPLLDMALMPDPDKVRIRVYQTNSTHKSMSALRQGSMILVWDEDFHHVEGPFEEAFFTHTSTSPNLQVIASLDVARRQMELEGYELTLKATELSLRIRREVNSHSLIARYFRVASAADMIPAEFRASQLA